MPSIDDNAKVWQMDLAARAGRAIQEYRKLRSWTALELASRTAALGYPISRVAISKIESNSRSGKLDISELIVLGAALGVPPILILYPEYPYGWVEVLPLPIGNGYAAQMPAARWFAGEQPLHLLWEGYDEFSSAAIELITTVHEQHAMQSVLLFGNLESQENPESVSDAKRAMISAAAERNEELSRKAAYLWEKLHGTTPPDGLGPKPGPEELYD